VSEARLRKSYDRLLAQQAALGDTRLGCPSVEAIAALLARDGDEEARLALLDHVMGCPFCQPEFELLRAARRASGGQEATGGEPPDPV
jgi:hypothetical protein